MSRIILVFVIVLLLTACKKGENYCPVPEGVLGFKPHESVYETSDEIFLELDVTEEFRMEIMKDRLLFNFSVPTIFENPKGDRGADVVDDPNYTFRLKDSTNAPDSILIEGYGFNDCGRSEVAKTTIRFLN